MTKSVKDAAKQFFNEQSLSDEGLQKILALSQTENRHVDSTTQHSSNKTTKWWVRYGLAASLLVISFWFGLKGINQYQQAHRIELIVAEVVKNHSNLKPLEVNSSNFLQVVNYFDQLAFLPSITQLTLVNDQLGQQLLGGRYCSIQGFTAAQLRMENKIGQFSTLFQTEDAEEFSMIPDLHLESNPVVRFNKGYQVSLWREKGLLMVLVEPASSIVN